MTWNRLRVIPLAVAVLLAAMAACHPGRTGSETQASAGAAPGVTTVFHPHPDHAWNRLYRAVYLRRAASGQEYGQDEVDPLLWPDSRHLLEGKSHHDAIRALDDFLAQGADAEIRDPLRRAVLQHDLWAVFDWLVARPPEEQAAVRPLAVRLARALQRLALTREEISRLPDNYAAAVATRQWLAEPDLSTRHRPFLPGELFDPKGPWVEVVVSAHSTTPLHVEFVGARSAFQVFLRLPGGRAATQAYIQRLGAPREQDRAGAPGSLPQFPPGTQVALVRRMMLFDSEGGLVRSPLVETVQLRVYREVPRTLSRSVELAAKEQDFFEFELHRAELFAGRAGGLRPVGPEERRLMSFLVSRQHVPRDPFPDVRELEGQPMMRTCALCHSGSGIYSVMSFARRPVYIPQADPAGRAAAYLKRQRYDWGMLQGMVQAAQ
ncbi:MAG: hypothetical protein L0099_15295 [Acidobacteria bacterium]|nr:hypothetical protein [Acidobacteriota bacterium]